MLHDEFRLVVVVVIFIFITTQVQLTNGQTML